jgi:hypothetical protein
LNANDVQLGLAPQYTTDNVVIEIFVSGERQHDSRRFARPAGEQTGTDTLGIEAGFVLSTHCFGVSFSRFEIRLDLRASPQIVADHVVNIGKIERRVLLDNFLGGSAVAKSPHHGV